MKLSAVDVYRDILPKTNCGECGEKTCLAFAVKVVSENLPLSNCPHISDEKKEKFQEILNLQHKKGVFTKKDPAKDALVWAKNRAADTKISILPKRIGGEIVEYNGKEALKLPYFNSYVYITEEKIFSDRGELDHWEQVFLYNHISQGGSKNPTGKYVPFHELPNTVSKIKSLEKHIKKPLQEYFKGKVELLKKRALFLNAQDVTEEFTSCDLALLFKPLPKVPVLLLFWDEEKEEEYMDAQVNILFDETIIEHLDIESILFLLEKLVSLLRNL